MTYFLSPPDTQSNQTNSFDKNVFAFFLYLKLYLSDFYKCFTGKYTSFIPLIKQADFTLTTKKALLVSPKQNITGMQPIYCTQFSLLYLEYKETKHSSEKEKWLYRHIRHSHHYYFARELSSPTLIISYFSTY